MSETLALVTTFWGLLMGLAPALQIRVILRDRDATGTALGWVLIVLIGSCLWLAYGVVNKVGPIIVTNVVAVVVTTALVVTMRIYRRSEQPSSRAEM